MKRFGHKARAGTWPVADLASSNYLLTNLAKQSDMPNGMILWVVNYTDPTPARIRKAISKVERADGGYIFDWTFALMTPGMYSHWISTYFTGSARSTDMTVLTYSGITPVYLQAKMHLPATKEVEGRVYRNVTFRFDGGVIIT